MPKVRTHPERRRYLRLPFTIDVYFKAMDEVIDTSGLRASKARNLSPGGLLFRSPFRMKPGTIIQMMLELSRPGRRRRIPALARVACCRQLLKNRFEIGAGFVDIFPKDLEFLKSLSSPEGARPKRPGRA